MDMLHRTMYTNATLIPPHTCFLFTFQYISVELADKCYESSTRPYINFQFVLASFTRPCAFSHLLHCSLLLRTPRICLLAPLLHFLPFRRKWALFYRRRIRCARFYHTVTTLTIRPQTIFKLRCTFPSAHKESQARV